MRKVFTCYNTIMLHAQYARTHKHVGIRGQIFTETNDDQDLCDNTRDSRYIAVTYNTIVHTAQQ